MTKYQSTCPIERFMLSDDCATAAIEWASELVETDPIFRFKFRGEWVTATDVERDAEAVAAARVPHEAPEWGRLYLAYSLTEQWDLDCDQFLEDERAEGSPFMSMIFDDAV